MLFFSPIRTFSFASQSTFHEANFLYVHSINKK